MTITDELLMAYVDDELDAATRAAVEAAMAESPDLAQRVARQQELRRQVRAAFGGVLEEPVPDRLIDAARRSPTGARETVITDLDRARAERKQRAGRRWSWPEWSAMAASVVLGAAMSQALFRPFPAQPIVARDGRLLAQDALARALSDQLSADQPADARIAMGPSFRSKQGTFCRSFVIRDGRSLAGLACREGESWPVELVMPGGEAAVANGGYAMAGADLPAALLHAIEERIDGEPLDADAEAAARRDQWR
jgi:putative zinc finger protein